MLSYILRRLLGMGVTLVAVTIITFIIIQLPPGDVVTAEVTRMEAQTGQQVPPEIIEGLRARYGLGEPAPVQFWKWVSGFPRGDFGLTNAYQGSVAEIIKLRIGYTLLLVILTLIISWGLAIPFGIYAATHKNSIPDYILSAISFIGISTPNFLLGLIYLALLVFVLQSSYAGGFFSQKYATEPWSWGRVVDMGKHLIVPLLILGLGGMAGTYRIMRANLLDVLDQQFVETARAKGLKESAVIYKHATRIAINPLISRFGMSLPVLISGAVIISVVLDFPTLGPALQRSLLQQDMYLAGTILLMMTIILLVGNLLADILLAWSDPRIRYE
jgi:peptide/nickel transport system permease protein